MIWQTFIPGVPKPQGSKTSGINQRTGKTFVREDNAGTKPWRKRMVEALQDSTGKPLAVFDSAVWVSLRFVFLRPKSHARNSLPTSKQLGDVDKLTRNVLDALTQAGVITDDKFVVRLREVEKVYGPNPGLHIEVGPAVPNPFADISRGHYAPMLVPRGAVEAWQPSAEAITQHALEASDCNRFAYEVRHGSECDPLGVECPRCNAPLVPGDNMGGVKCSADTCDFWFCY